MLLGALGLLGAGSYCAFVPRAQEPPYRFVRAWGGEGTAAGEFRDPTGVAVAGAEVFVSDARNGRIQVFDAEGRFSHKWGGPFAMDGFGPFRGWFAVVTSVAVGPEGAVFAADFYNHRIQKFAGDGTFLTSFGEEGSGPGAFEHAMAVAAAGDGAVFATDLRNQRVTVWEPASSVRDP